MKLFHGSNCVVKHPRADASRRSLDFGPGFYLTSYEFQAQNWALRKFARSGGVPTVNVFAMGSIPLDYDVLEFPEPDAEWVEFVCSCRKNKVPSRSYDIVVGGVANDKVYQAVDMYFRGYWDMDTTLKALRYYEVNDQWCLASQRAIDACLLFVGSYEVTR